MAIRPHFPKSALLRNVCGTITIVPYNALLSFLQEEKSLYRNEYGDIIIKKWGNSSQCFIDFSSI